MDNFFSPIEYKDGSKEIFKWFLFNLCVLFTTKILFAFSVAVKRTKKKGLDNVSFIQILIWYHHELHI